MSAIASWQSLSDHDNLWAYYFSLKMFNAAPTNWHWFASLKLSVIFKSVRISQYKIDNFFIHIKSAISQNGGVSFEIEQNDDIGIFMILKQNNLKFTLDVYIPICIYILLFCPQFL